MRRHLPAALLGASLAGLACTEPTAPGEAPGYDPTSLTGGLLYHWPLGRTVAVYVAPPSSVDLRAAVTRAAAGWRSVLRYREVDVVLVDDVTHADVVVGIADATYPVVLDECGGISIGAGFTLLCPDADSARTLRLVDGRPGRVKMAVVIDPAAAISDRRDAIIAHELGHVLGIAGHSTAPTDLMYVDPRVVAPSARDAATLRYVIHRPAQLRL